MEIPSNGAIIDIEMNSTNAAKTLLGSNGPIGKSSISQLIRKFKFDVNSYTGFTFNWQTRRGQP